MRNSGKEISPSTNWTHQGRNNYQEKWSLRRKRRQQVTQKAKRLRGLCLPLELNIHFLTLPLEERMQTSGEESSLTVTVTGRKVAQTVTEKKSLLGIQKRKRHVFVTSQRNRISNLQTRQPIKLPPRYKVQRCDREAYPTNWIHWLLFLFPRSCWDKWYNKKEPGKKNQGRQKGKRGAQVMSTSNERMEDFWGKPLAQGIVLPGQWSTYFYVGLLARDRVQLTKTGKYGLEIHLVWVIWKALNWIWRPISRTKSKV